MPQAHDKRVLAAAAEVVAKGLAKITLLGKEVGSHIHLTSTRPQKPRQAALLLAASPAP